MWVCLCVCGGLGTYEPNVTTEVFDMVALLVRLHPLTRFAGDVEVDEPYTRQLLAQTIQRNNGRHDGASFVRVCEDDAGHICGFIAGMLDRVYHIGTKLWAQDMFFTVEPKAPVRAGSLLLDAYIEWAESNPKVYEIHLSHLDALPGQAGLSRNFERRGFIRCGAVFRKTAEPAQTMEAA